MPLTPLCKYLTQITRSLAFAIIGIQNASAGANTQQILRGVRLADDANCVCLTRTPRLDPSFRLLQDLAPRQVLELLSRLIQGGLPL